MTVHITLYASARDTAPIARQDFDDWPDVAASLADIVDDPRPSKDACLLWAPHRLRDGGTRRAADVEAVTLLVLDVDAVDDLDALAARVGALGVDALMYESPSSTDDDPRVRIVARPSRDMAPDECARLRFAFAEKLGLSPGCGVEGAADPARGFFAGRVTGTRERRTWIWGA